MTNLEEKYNLLTLTFEDLIEKLGISKENVLLVGSLALFAHGFPVEGISDVDAEIKNLNPDQVQKLLLLASANAGTEYSSSVDRIDVIYKNIKMNLWVVSDFTHSFCYKNYFKVAEPLSVLKVKLSYGRKKDLSYLRYLLTKLV